MDRLTAAERSANMARIKGRDTTPEKIVRSLLHALGFRFRLHDRRLPGTPDIVMPSRHTVIMVHGCFWHRHPGCRFAYTPKSRTRFWKHKFGENVARDRRHLRALRRAGWKVVTVWECETAAPGSLTKRLTRSIPTRPRQSRSRS